MARSLVPRFGLFMLLVGCTVEGDNGDTNPFGTDAATGAATSTATGEGSGSDPSATGAGSATGPSSTTSTSTTSTTSPPGDTSTSSPPGTSDGPPRDSSGSPGDGQLGGCIGTGAWTSCAMYCEANLDVCVQGGCGGATVVYYKDATDCEAQQVDSTEATPCDQPFAMGGGISFARCCCM